MKKILVISLVVLLFMLSACNTSSTNVEKNEDNNSTQTVNDTVEENKISTQGKYTLAECQEKEGFFVMYPDGSFDTYFIGNVLQWNHQYMTYGNDYWPQDLVVNLKKMERNKNSLKQGKLVLFWAQNENMTGKQESFYPVVESGYSLFRKNEENELEGLFYHNYFYEWHEGEVMYWSGAIEYETINGVQKEDYDAFPEIKEDSMYTSFPPNETYVIGSVEGTALIEKEYTTDYMYLIQGNEKMEYEITPTTDGYAVFDFSSTKPGKYIYAISYWNTEQSTRSVRSIYIEVE